jgi:tetratricopeptide (TPR) repeat protein
MTKAIIPLLITFLLGPLFAFGKEDFLDKLKIVKSEKNDLKKSQLLLDLVTESENANFHLIEPEAIKMLEKGIISGSKQEIYAGKFVLAIILLNKGKCDLAKQYLLQSKRYFSREENMEIVAMHYNYLGHCDYKIGRYRDAIDSYFKAKMLREEMDNTIEANLSNSFIAMAYVQTGKLDLAEKIYKECIKNLLPLKKYRTLSNYHSQLGEIYSLREDRRMATYYFEKGTEYAYKSDDPATIARAQNYTAISKYFKGDMEGAMKLFYKSLQNRLAIGDSKLVCESYYNIGTLYMELKNFQKAEEYFLKSISYAKKHNFLYDEAEALLEISNIKKEQKDFEISMEYLKKYVATKDKIYNQLKSENDSDNDLIELMNRSQVLEKANVREELLTNMIKEEKRKVNYILLGSLMCIVGILFLFRKKM